MQLLRADADLRTEAELAAVREARRGVDVDRRRVDFRLKAMRMFDVVRDDRLRMARIVAVDMCDGFF